ncbi:MAG: hypothetical protein D6679_14080 [Candidatus Hydrogenedentota bacterium]|nr:MAG: hypothetical protein D6679_14080 [Candidatus Hydrogenedentota bacterium]
MGRRVHAALRLGLCRFRNPGTYSEGLGALLSGLHRIPAMTARRGEKNGGQKNLSSARGGFLGAYAPRNDNGPLGAQASCPQGTALSRRLENLRPISSMECKFSSLRRRRANVLDSGGVDYSYDMAGEVTAVSARSITYDAEGHLKTDSTPQGTISYDYDAFERRARSTVGGTVTVRLWDEAGNEVARYAW